MQVVVERAAVAQPAYKEALARGVSRGRWSAARASTAPGTDVRKGTAAMRHLEERFTTLRLSAACAHLCRETVSELLAITAELIEERKCIRRLLERLPEKVAEVGKLLNELSR